MSQIVNLSRLALILLVGGGSLWAATLASCTTTTTATTTATTAPATAPATGAAALFTAPQKGSAQLWSETCSRCHNVRSPSAYSAAQWQVIMHDMRIRANLTGQEQRQILEFLQSAH